MSKKEIASKVKRAKQLAKQNNDIYVVLYDYGADRLCIATLDNYEKSVDIGLEYITQVAP